MNEFILSEIDPYKAERREASGYCEVKLSYMKTGPAI